MRVVSGYLRSRKLLEVDSNQTRSTKDRVKESMFNMLYPLSRFDHGCDLFAGSGALGIEAISRGVKTVDFVEQSREAFRILKENLRALELNRNHRFNQDVNVFLSQNTKVYDLIILDPPYGENYIDRALKLIVKNNLLHQDGCVVSLSHKDDPISIPEVLSIKKERNIGITRVIIYEWSD
ncbi:16S rRNA (guanine(966)-N(2))-methyltransferase RsmD [Liberiplasma polymorphum]|uniref:16S rRNA (guanine(966)-N(2))-methyltransferase RsmD n=1 Tax=Liberiplasma polymorphum TaxID=3374570 RepID=UPI00377619CC